MSHKGSKFEDVIRRVSNKTNLTVDNCKSVYSAIIDELVDCFKADGKVKINRLGTLSVDQYGYHYYPANYLMKERNEQY